MNIKYRPEIDGLRALAVISVILFHAEFQYNRNLLFQGGYVGVDVFFVISGYLITLILLRELSNKTFSYAKFYERRARRLLPVLFCVMIVTIPFAEKLMFPKALESYSGSILSTIFFSSNIWFWLEDSYWAGPSNLKPFLHTWSLSLEEQFYIFYPPVLILLFRFLRKNIFLCFLLMFSGSLLFAQLTKETYQEANFFLIFARSWELILGGLLAKREFDKGRNFSGHFTRYLPGIGVFFIIASVFYFKKNTPHPSLISLMPTVGTALIIWFGGKGDKFSNLLSTKPLVFIGLLSYSLYLWHQPVFAFARVSGIAGTFLLKVLFVVLSILLSILSYQFIEKYFRYAKTASLKKFAAFTVGLFLLLVGYSIPTYIKTSNILAKNREETKQSKPNAKYVATCGEIKKTMKIDCRVVGSGNKVTVIWGDSHAGVLAGEEPRISKNEAILFLTHPACPPLLDTYIKKSYQKLCDDPFRGKKIIDYINKINPKNLIIMARWNLFYDPMLVKKYGTDIKDRFSNKVESRVTLIKDQLRKTLSKIPPKTAVVLISQSPDLTFISKNKVLGKKTVEAEEVINFHLPEKQIFDNITKIGNLHFINLLDVFCDSKNCHIQNNEGHSYYKDENHLNKLGSELVWSEISKNIIFGEK